MAVCIENISSIYERKQPFVISPRIQGLLILVALTLFVLKIWCSVTCTQYGYMIADQRRKTVELNNKKMEAEAYLSVLLDPRNLIVNAKKKLGFKNIDKKNIYTIKDVG
jgi:hypothetical protein